MKQFWLLELKLDIGTLQLRLPIYAGGLSITTNPWGADKYATKDLADAQIARMPPIAFVGEWVAREHSFE